MHNAIILIVTALAAPAFADTTHQFELALKNERYTVLVADDSCGELQVKSPQRERSLRVCVRANSTDKLRIEIERRTRDLNDEVHTKTTVVMARGSSLNLDDLKLTLK